MSAKILTFGGKFANMKALKIIATSVVALAGALTSASAGDLKLDTAPASRFIEVDVHALGGGGSVTQNYCKLFPQIENLNVNMGGNFGIGGRAVFGLREYLGLGTAIDFTVTNYDTDMLVYGQADSEGISAAYIDNIIYKVTVPVFVSLRFNVDRSVRWNIDAGLYYSYGLGGRQKQKIFRGEINAMGELVTERENLTTDYYHSGATFINVYNRGDIGVHIGTSLNFGPHLLVGGQLQYGFKNSARKTGVVDPRVHNLSVNAVLGYRF